jgi:hypothetical protein
VKVAVGAHCGSLYSESAGREGKLLRGSPLVAVAQHWQHRDRRSTGASADAKSVDNSFHTRLWTPSSEPTV